MSEKPNITPQEPVKAEQKTAAADELSEEALDQVAGGPAINPTPTIREEIVVHAANTTALKVSVPHATVTGQVASSPKA
jgi:hypothetical protein